MQETAGECILGIQPGRMSKNIVIVFVKGVRFRSGCRGSATSVHRLSREFFEVIQVLMERLFQGREGQKCGNDADGPDRERAQL
jgi:hypothetical protein